MAENSSIEWTDHTFNPWIGCTKVSPGCDNCYAARQDAFRHWTPEGWGGPRKRTKTWGEPVRWNEQLFAQCATCSWRGPAYVNDMCPNSCQGMPLVAARCRVFCASLADVFDNEVDPQWRLDLFRLIHSTPMLDWLLLTKRIGNVTTMLCEALDLACKQEGGPDACAPWLMRWANGEAAARNVWLGATIVNQEEADRDILKLLAVPARVRFLSMEPLLSPIDLTGEYLTAKLGRYPFKGLPDEHRTKLIDLLDWVIVGGESGHGARPMNPQWARDIRDQCAAAGVAFLHKQNGEFASVSEVAGEGAHFTFPDGATVRRVGKKAAGRLLDGVQHDGFPEVIS